MLSSLLLTTLVWPAAVTQHCAPKEDTFMIGVAQDFSGTHLYCELVSQPDEKTFTLIYIKDNKVFAEKKLAYEISTKPSVIQNDFRTGELRQANVNEKEITLQYQVSSQKKLGVTTIPQQKADVVDAGFNNFIRENWGELKTGKTRALSFASIAHLRALPLRVSQQPLEKCATAGDLPPSMTCFFVEIDNALLRMVLGNIKITYDQNHRLHEFNGVVNIEDEKQDNQKAIIRYFYRDDYVVQNK